MITIKQTPGGFVFPTCDCGVQAWEVKARPDHVTFHCECSGCGKQADFRLEIAEQPWTDKVPIGFRIPGAVGFDGGPVRMVQGPGVIWADKVIVSRLTPEGDGGS